VDLIHTFHLPVLRAQHLLGGPEEVLEHLFNMISAISVISVIRNNIQSYTYIRSAVQVRDIYYIHCYIHHYV
jgi:hypothetical protein